ncbi:MAG: outer membrane beta-barrel protein [Planctomycetia bacterium]|nr:outer membrane beta-barrel protein [Planctomycetia bacterium]
MKKGYFSISSFLAAMLLSCGVVSATESVMVAEAETATITGNAVAEEMAEATATAEVAAAEVGEIQYVEYQSRLELSGHLVGSWMDGFFMEGKNRTNLNQLMVSAERALDTSTGFDWGYNLDVTFGTENAQCYGDGEFDGSWGVSGDGYCTSIYQIYAEVGYYDMSLKIGKFSTIVGYESFDETEELFNTHSYMYEYEPMTHCGGLLTWDATEKFSLNFGLTTGCDNSFENPNGDFGVLFGASYQVTDRLSVGYAAMWNRVHGEERSAVNFAYYDIFGGHDGLYAHDKDEFQQTVTVSWDITCRLNYTFTCNVGSMVFEDQHNVAHSHVGLGNYFTYILTDKVTLGLRYEWFHQEIGGGNFGYDADFDDANYHELTLAAKYMPTENIFVRPEIRYDWVEEGTRDSGFSGGVGFGLMF